MNLIPTFHHFVLILCFSVFSQISSDANKNAIDYLITVPNILSGKEANICIVLFRDSHSNSVVIDLKLISLINQKILSEVTQPINSESQCITLPLTNVTENRALLQVSGDEIENGTRIINLRPEIAFTLIETKKEFYEAGEEVEFRLLSFDEKLRPIAEKYDAIWIEDSTYFPVFQWTNVQSPSSGILTYKFQLSNDINYGIWRVKTLTKHRQVTEKVFTVSRVSRTEIKIHIEANEFILATDKEAKLNVCVTNVYGYRLKGDLQIIARYRRIPVTQAIEAKLPSYSNTTQIDGCEQIILKASVLFWDSISNEFNLRTIQVNFQFSDHASGYIEARAIDLTVAIQPFRISFPSRKLAKSYFKHHLPYFGFVFIEKPDLSRIANEQITICYELRKVPWIEERNETCREEYSNNDGFIVFEIPPVDRVVSQIFIKASSVNDPDIVSTDVLDPWFTTATSSITMKPLFHESICSREIELEVFISNATQSKQKLFYQILTSSTLHPPKSVQLSLDQWKPQTTPEGEEKQLPIIKKGKLVVELPSSMSVYSTYNRIVVYSVDSNGNLVADSGAFEIDCLQDTDLKISMREEVSKLDVSIGEQASDSLCAFELSHDENRKMLTKLRFLNILKAFEVNQYAPVLDKCQQQKIKNFRQATPSARNQNDLQLNAALLPVIDFHSRWDTFNDIGIQIFANKFFDESPCEWDVFPKGYPDRVLAAFRQSQITIKQQYMKERFDFVRLRKLEAESIHDQIGPQWSLIAASNSSIFKVDKTVFGSAVCAEPTRGIRFVYSKSESERNPIKMIAKLPSNTIIGEEVQIEVYIENIKEGCMPLQVTIQSSQQFNVIRSSPPQCVCSNSIAKFTINPKVFGRINIQVIAKRIQDSSVPKCDHISRAPFSQMVMKESIIVKMPGLHIRDFKTTLHCSQNKKSFSLERSANTRRARVSSDIIDLALNEFKNSRTNPTALDLLSSLAIYSYLTLNTKPEIEQKLQNWLQLEIKKIYQELLTHHFADGSFGPAQARSMGSNFLFTVQAFNVLCNFKQTTLKIVNDYNIRRTLLWIYSRQSSDGCFYPQDASIDSWPLNIQSTFETTAFVLSSLLQTNINNVTLERDRQVLLPPLDAAIQCLKILSDNQKEAHSALANAILAYIESMRGNEVTSKTWLANLTKNEIESNDELYWNGNHQKEIAAFAILTYLKHNEKTEAMKIGRWLLRQPKIFQSPITALAMINVWPFFRSDSQLNLKLRNSRPLVLKDGETHTIPLSPRTELELIGKGCAIIEEEVFDKVTTRSQKYFNISITDTEKGFVTCRKRVMRICMRAIVEERFNFTQVKIQIPSGYKIDQRILSAAIKPRSVLVNFRVQNQYLYLHFKPFYYLSNAECLVVPFFQEHIVNNMRPSFIQVFDAYKARSSPREVNDVATYSFTPNCIIDDESKSDNQEQSDDPVREAEDNANEEGKIFHCPLNATASCPACENNKVSLKNLICNSSVAAVTDGSGYKLSTYEYLTTYGHPSIAISRQEETSDRCITIPMKINKLIHLSNEGRSAIQHSEILYLFIHEKCTCDLVRSSKSNGEILVIINKWQNKFGVGNILQLTKGDQLISLSTHEANTLKCD